MARTCCGTQVRSVAQRIVIVLALPATAVGCAVSVPGHPAGASGPALDAARAVARSAHSSQPGAGRSHPRAFVASVLGAGGRVSRGLSVFSAADGHVIRKLTRDRRFPVAVALSPDGRWVYYFRESDQAPGRCKATGFTEPPLWRVPASGGRPRRAGLRTTSLAFSADGRMAAYTSSRRCGRTVWIVIRDKKAGTTRHILLARNVPTSNNPIFTAQLSWAPDDRHLAVAVTPAAAINSVSVVNARTATRMPAKAIAPCTRQEDECLDPGFDRSGGLTFLKWRNQPGRHPERVVRWQHGHVSRLVTLSRNQSSQNSASIAAGGAGGAVLIEGGIRRHQVWRWSAGRITLIRSSSRRMLVSDVLWL
jgi:hypothetical protein